MASLANTIPRTRTYEGKATIQFVTDETELGVTIDTNRLHMRSVQPDDVGRYVALFEDPAVMEKYGDGRPRTPEQTKERVELWVKRWFQGDPYSGLAVFARDGGKFLGHVVLGHGDEPGHAEIAFIFHQFCWNQKYASEAVDAILESYVSALIKEGYQVDGKPLSLVTATARPDNVASVKILRKKMEALKEDEKYGAMRRFYQLRV